MRSLLSALAFAVGTAIASLPAAPTSTPEPSPPEEAAKAMRVPEGFQVSLFAAEPDVLQPVGMCIDDRGRLWVAENFSYPRHHDDPQRDRILIFEDTDGDGRFDHRTVFYDRLNYVTGIEVGFGGAWVMSPPHFFFIPDRDHDDVPDGEPQVLLDGFGNHANSHNLANGFAWGPDGWLYNTHGRTNWSLIGTPGSPKEERIRFDGGVWRYHPVRHAWEAVADGCTNPWGVDWDDYGQAFIPNTVDPHLFHAIPGAHYEPWRNRESSRFAYQRIETIADHLHFTGTKNVRDGLGTAEELAAGGGHSHCGILVYLGDNWPERYRNTVFLHNTHGKRINNDLLERRGSGYVAHHGPDFLVSPDPWFMGVSFRTAPDGSVYISDWSDTGECHSTRNTRRGTGRLYRISYGEPAHHEIDMAALSNEELVRRQLHRNDWHVRHARRVLQERSAAGQEMSAVHGALRAILAENPDVTRKLRALWALWVTEGIGDNDLTGLLSHPSEHLRSWAVTLLCEDREPPAPARTRFVELAAGDSSALVRLHLASALQRLAPAERWSLAEALLSRGEDDTDQNLPLMIWYGIEPLVHQDVRRFSRLITASRLTIPRRHIARRIASLPQPTDGLEEVLAVLQRHPDPVIVDGLLAGLQGRGRVETPANWTASSLQLAREESLAARIAELGSHFGVTEPFEKLRERAENGKVPAEERLRALARVVEAQPPGWDAWLQSQLADPVLQSPALLGLARSGDAGIPDRILALYPNLSDSDARRSALLTLASRRSWASALLDAVEAGRIPPAHLTAFTIRQLDRLGDENLQKRVGALWGTVRQTPTERRLQINRYREELQATLDQADRAQGRLLYQQLCATCHRLFEHGGELGPELTGAQRTSLDYLLEHVVDPGAAVANEFRLQVLELADGRTVSGMVAGESETTLTVRSPAGETTLSKSDVIRNTTLPESLMPGGLLESLTPAQRRDLVAYLMSPRQVPLPE